MRSLRLWALLGLLALGSAGCGQIPVPEEEGSQDGVVEDAMSEESEGPDGSDETEADVVDDSEGSGEEADEAEGVDEGGEEAAYTGPAGDEEDSESEEAAPLRMASEDGAVVSSDMLGEEEIARAEALALESEAFEPVVAAALDRDSLDADADVGALSDAAERPSYRVLYTQRHADKYARTRKAEVAVYRYDTGEVSLSTVDLETGEVEALDVPEGFPAPLVPEETAEATRVALADGDVRARLEEAGIEPDEARANGILTVAREEGARCASARCVRLFFSTFEQPVPAFSAVVDLDALELVELEEMPGAEGEDR